MTSNIQELLTQAQQGFGTLGIDSGYTESALEFLEQWLTDEQFTAYVPDIITTIEQQHWDYLLDSFYKVIPFGTGGRRGEVGFGPNRINAWTLQASAQGHSQYLLARHGESARTRGVVLAYDVRTFYGNLNLEPHPDSPLYQVRSRDLAERAAEVYAANGFVVHFFSEIRTTPELSFAIRDLDAIAGAMVSASHNPPDHNGKKVYDEYGGQLIPPADEALVNEVTQSVVEIKMIDFDQAQADGLVQFIPDQIDESYLATLANLSLSSARDVDIVYTPLHGCGKTSIQRMYDQLGFTSVLDPRTSNPSGKFENITFNIPNPEVVESFDTTLVFAREQNADLIINSDPDADRLGVMVNHHGDWRVIDGQAMAAVLTQYVIDKRPEDLAGGVLIKTAVTNGIMDKMAEAHGITIVSDLLVGFKYIGAEVNKLEAAGKVDTFLLACEDSHGYMTGNYTRDKDGALAALWLAELAAEQKQLGRSLIDYLDDIYIQYGYVRNYLTEIRMLGAIGFDNIQKIQNSLRANPPQAFGEFAVLSVRDRQTEGDFLSETDKVARNVLTFTCQNPDGVSFVKVTIRPSGTEPKIKFYFEIQTSPMTTQDLAKVMASVEKIREQFERAVLRECYEILEIDFPERGFLLFWQLPLKDKLKYFEIEPQIAALQSESNQAARAEKLAKMTQFLGSDPLQKVNRAFIQAYGESIEVHLDLSTDSSSS